MNAKANNKFEKAQELQKKLYLAAKKSKTRRFHALYDKVTRKDFLEMAWEQVKRNKGSAGIDNETINDIKQKGEEIVLTEIQQMLENTRNYHPKRVKRVYIPKPNGKQRPLGIPTVRDRIIQMSTKQVIEPIFEADFLNCSYGFRPNRSAHDALEEIKSAMNAGFTIVLDADIKGFFDNINHDKLLELVYQRINDRRILKLIRKWLKCGVMDSGVPKETEKGTPQGGVISPLLANIYLHEFDKFWVHRCKVNGILVRYADDFVIMFRTKKDAELGLKLVKAMLEYLGLELNEEKTKVVYMEYGKEGFDFLGFHHRIVKLRKHMRYCIQKWPSHKSMSNIRSEVREFLKPGAKLCWHIDDIVKELNPLLRGWMNYFRFGNSARKFSQIDDYVHERLVLWWSRKHRKKGRRWKDFPYEMFKKCGIQLMSGNVRQWTY